MFSINSYFLEFSTFSGYPHSAFLQLLNAAINEYGASHLAPEVPVQAKCHGNSQFVLLNKLFPPNIYVITL